jgi:cytochrome P450
MMKPDEADLQKLHREKAFSLPIEEINPAQPHLFQQNVVWPYFERLRRDDPVHYSEEHEFGPYWSITKHADIVTISRAPEIFSSEGGVTIVNQGLVEGALPMFIAMDPPRHGEHRGAVSPAFTPGAMSNLEPLIRERAGKILDALPIGIEFDWVKHVSTELAAMTLATLFGVPQEDRHQLGFWSNSVISPVGKGLPIPTLQRKAEIFSQFSAYFTRLWNARVNMPPSGDLVSMLAHGERTKTMTPLEYFGNIVLLTLGGMETNRSMITASLLALNEHPDEFAKLRKDPSLIPSMVAEAIRWQSPAAHMRRTALRDFEVGGKLIRKGDKVVIWIASGDRDSEAIEDADQFIIDRRNPHQHIAFGAGIHRCVGSRLAELQLRVFWEELLPRFPEIRVVGDPRRVFSCLLMGFESMNVIIPRRN